MLTRTSDDTPATRQKLEAPMSLKQVAFAAAHGRKATIWFDLDWHVEGYFAGDDPERWKLVDAEGEVYLVRKDEVALVRVGAEDSLSYEPQREAIKAIVDPFAEAMDRRYKLRRDPAARPARAAS
jgi:hypothetical protein